MPQLDPTSLAPDLDSTAVLTVSSLNKLARSLLESNFPSVTVEGEISNLVTPASGHMYLTLKDKKAQVRCAMFRNRNMLLRFRPRDGMQIVVRGRLSIYEGRGDYQLIVESMEEAGDGALRRAFEELKRKLQQEGLFDEAEKQEVGNHFRHIGVITSRTGAAIRDIVSVFGRRFPGIQLTLLPVAVQGEEAVNEIVAAIGKANRLRDVLGIEALIVGRGGGSLEDLQAFNEEAVARAIFASELPVVSAVGHEIDFTIADFVADLRAPTPSAAAELLSPDVADSLEYLEACHSQLLQAINGKLKDQAKQLHWLHRQLKRPDRKLQEHAQTLDRLDGQMRRVMQNQFSSLRGEVRQRQRALLAGSPQARISRTGDRMRSLARQITHSMLADLSRRKSQISNLSRGLNAVSPLQVLARGYSITANADGDILRSTESVAKGARLTTTLTDGTITSTVDEIHKKQ